jgi:hypothetical protein
MSKHFFILLCSFSMIVRCTRPPECELPSETGPCRAMFISHYFNPSTNGCEEFVYGGCGGIYYFIPLIWIIYHILGNENRFKNEEECLAKCGDNNRTNKIIHEDE